MHQIHISPIPAQRFTVTLDNRHCTITLRQKGKRLYLDLDADNRAICRGAVCVNGASVVQSPSPYFTGSLHFYDTLGVDAPQHEGLNSRYLLLYVSEDEDLPEALRF